MKPFLIVVPENGLCNRIRCLAGARSFANDYDYWMVVLWTKTTDCKIKFQDLFCGFPAVIININWKHVPTKLVNFVAMLFRCIVVDGSNENVSIDKCYWNEIRNRKNLLIRSCFNLYDKSKIQSDYSLFKVKESLINKSDIEPCEVGIHIRRTDHGWSKFFSPTELFEEAIDSELKNNSSVKFFIATDDVNELNTIINKYPDHMYYQRNIPRNRNTKEGMEAAILDLYGLSMCKKVYGSANSSFSKFAADFGDSEYVELRKNLR